MTLPRASLAAALIAGSLTVAGAACGPPPSPSAVTAADAIVVIRSNVRDADLYVDGRLLAPIGALRGGVAVEPGLHRFELRHADYFSSYLELRLGRAEHRQVAMDMAAILP